MDIKPEVLDELLKGIKTQDDLAGPNGLLKALTKARWYPGSAASECATQGGNSSEESRYLRKVYGLCHRHCRWRDRKGSSLARH